MTSRSATATRRRRGAHRVPLAKPRAERVPTERELKLQVPDEAWDALRAELEGADAHRVDLEATYWDTPSGELGRAGIGLRVRREGDRWVQTLKAAGSHALERLEDEVPLGPALGGVESPAPLLLRHRSSAARRFLRAALALDKDAPLPTLVRVFQVRVQRRVRRLAEGSSVIELALDEGEILAEGRRRPLRELEFELREGNLRDLLVLARRWRERFGLWLAPASKAARGRGLAAGEVHGPAVKAEPLVLPVKPDRETFTAAVLDTCLAQVLANAGEMAAGSQADEHVHQLRVGLRRLRTALRELPWLDEEHARFEAPLVAVFRRLGERRDRSHVLHRIEPLVEAAGGPALHVPPGFNAGGDLAGLVRGAAFQDALLALLARAEQARSGGGGPVRRLLRRRAKRLHEQVTRDGVRFRRLPAQRQHRVRKRLKRLRYLAEFLAPLYPAGAVDAYVEALKPAQEALGDYNDEVMAQQLYGELAAADAGARFGIEWLRARQPKQAKACRKALRALDDVRPFWRKRR